MSEEAVIVKGCKRKSSLINEHDIKKHSHSKVLYDKKYSKPLKKKQSVYDPDEEARLERLVFGDSNDILKNLTEDENNIIVKEEIDVVIKEETDDIATKKTDNIVKEETDIVVKEDPTYINGFQVEDIETTEYDINIENIKERAAAWEDDDDNYTVDQALNDQNQKLSCSRPENTYTEYLRNKYQQFVGTPKWAELERIDKDHIANLDNDILKHSCYLDVPKVKNLPKDIIDIKALKALNKTTHTEGPIVSSLEFHPSSTVALVAGSSGVLSLFQVDGHTNDKLHSMKYDKFPISKAAFVKEGTEVLIGSAYYPYCHTYNLINGKMYKLPLPHGITNMKRFEISPDGRTVALCGRQGEIYLLDSSTKELIDKFKMNSKCKTLAFTPDSKTLITHGNCNEMHVWDLNTRTCMHCAIDDGCFSCMSLAISPNGQYIATGSAQGVVNIYDTNTVLSSKNPEPLKIVMNLVTSITDLKFNSTSEILSIASDKKNNAFKMLHIPSFTIFSNFPTLQTKIGMPQIINFSPGSGYLGIANRTGSALLYRLRHYGNY